MRAPATRVLETTKVPASLAGTPIIRVYGEDDEPERLIVLVATALKRRAPRDLVDACRSQRSSWRARLEAFHALLSEARGEDVVVVDPDALFVPQRGRPGHPLARRRDDVGKLLTISFSWGGWTMIRPAPTAILSEELESAPEAQSVASATEGLSPACRPIANRLVRGNVLHDEDLHAIFEQTVDAEAHLVRLGYDALSTPARETARRLAAIRSPSHLNGAFGCFPWTDATGSTGVSRDSVQELMDAGFLQADDESAPSDVLMPRLIRNYVRRQAEFIDRDELREVHHRCAAAMSSEELGDDPARAIERHVHAARSGDIQMALNTAAFFGSALRELATRISREEARFQDAASIFERLVSDFDSEDAYSWEYLGYNLARLDVEQGALLRNHERIRAAYEKAYRLAPRVPLYHGRWLGYRAELGEDVEAELQSALMRYAREYKEDPDRISYFFEPVLKGIRRAKQDAVESRILSNWRTLLRSIGRLSNLDDA